MLGAVLAHGFGRRLRLRPDAAAAGLVPVAAELLAPVAVQIVGQRRVVLPVVDLISVLIQILVVLSQRLAVDDTAEAPELA